jgi:DNA repair protein SbcC/Rad50
MSAWLKSLTVEDFRSIRGQVRVSLDAPVVLVQGSNGTGKTSLLSALELALTRAVTSLERFDREYIRHLPHKDAANGFGHVSLTAAGLASAAETALTVTGDTIEGSGLLSPRDARFFVERCYLAQATLGRLLEIYEHQDTRRTDSPLTRFVKELLGLEPLDALIDGLHSAGDLRRFRETAPLFWAARADLPGIQAEVAEAMESQTRCRNELAAQEATFRELAGDLLRTEDTSIDPNLLRPRLRVLADDSERKLGELARRRRDLAGAADQVAEAAAADADGARESAEAAGAAARKALAAWTDESGDRLNMLVRAIQAVFPDVPSSVTDAGAAHAAATTAVKNERKRLMKLAEADTADGRALAEIQDSVRRATSRIAAIDEEVNAGHGANEELAKALASLSSLIEGDDCPVCGRNFSEISSKPLAVHVSEKIASLVAAAGRLQALVRDRAATSVSVAQAQRQEANVAARRLSQSRRDELKVEIARLAEWSNELDVLAEAAHVGSTLQKAVAQAAQHLADLNSRASAVIGLRAQVGQYAVELGVDPPEPDASLGVVVGALLVEIGRQDERETAAKAARLLALDSLASIARLRERLEAAERSFHELAKNLRQLTVRKAEAERRINIAKDLAAKARIIRTDKVRQVFNDELNSIWRQLFIRLTPDEAFVPAFALPKSNTGPVQAILETHYRSGGKGGNPRVMLSAGNLNTAALTLFLALHLSVRPILPWLIIDDPVQSMDDVHIAQFAALLRTLKQKQRQVIIAVHDRQLFDYLALELSPAFNGDRLITIELGRDADGRTTAPWNLKTYEPDRAIAA